MCAIECLVPPPGRPPRARDVARTEPFLRPINFKRQLIKLKQSLFCAYICMRLIRDGMTVFIEAQPCTGVKRERHKNEGETLDKRNSWLPGDLHFHFKAPITRVFAVCSKSDAGFASLFYCVYHHCFELFSSPQTLDLIRLTSLARVVGERGR